MRAQNLELLIHPPAACVVRLHGEHDVSSLEEVSAALATAGGYHRVVVDLARCTFIDSSLISIFLAASRRARARGGSVELVVPSEANAVRRTLELANVQRVLPFHASCASALESVAAGEPIEV